MNWDITLWEPTLSPHKTGFVTALAEHPSVRRARMVAHADITPERKQQGWTTPDLASDRFFVDLSDVEIERMIATSPNDAVHLITGMRGSRTVTTALKAAIRYRRRYAIMSEPRVSEGLFGLLRFGQSIVTEGRLRRTADFVLAIGAHGPKWFAKTGYRRDRIFPFAYFLSNAYPTPERRPRTQVIVSYLGRLEREKGIDVFLRAMSKLPDSMRARVAGHGSMVEVVRRWADASSGRFRYDGVLAMADVPTYLDEADVLVVPSRSTNDGWAAVVSEALLHGVAVVASNKVGASVLLDEPIRGKAVPFGNASAIAQAVEQLSLIGRLEDSARHIRSTWANERLSATGGADYLVRILAHLYNGQTRPPAFYD